MCRAFNKHGGKRRTTIARIHHRHTTTKSPYWQAEVCLAGNVLVGTKPDLVILVTHGYTTSIYSTRD